MYTNEALTSITEWFRIDASLFLLHSEHNHQALCSITSLLT